MGNKMLVVIPKTAKVSEDKDWIYISISGRRPCMFPKGSIVLSSVDDADSWRGEEFKSVWIDELVGGDMP